MSDTQSCAGCRFWELSSRMCRRHAPQRITLTVPSQISVAAADYHYYWPLTLNDDWCGEFEPLPVVDDKTLSRERDLHVAWLDEREGARGAGYYVMSQPRPAEYVQFAGPFVSSDAAHAAIAEPEGEDADEQAVPRTSGWITDRPPTSEDTNDANDCVLVTYRNGLTGWEPFADVDDLMALQSDGGVIAWQRIPNAFRMNDNQS